MDLVEQRLRARAARRALSAEARLAVAAAVATLVTGLVPPPAVAGLYVATDGEVDPAPLVAMLTALGWTITLPVATGDVPYLAEDRPERRPGRYGIWEPTGPLVPVTAHAVLIVPLVLFDHQLHRVGRGAGYYDRLLGPIAPENRPLLIGLAHDFQEVPRLDPQPHDVAMDHIVTPTRVLARPT